VLTAVSHHRLGFVRGGGVLKVTPGHYYQNPSAYGERAYRMARRIPREGILLCSWQVGHLVANRAHLMVWRQLKDWKQRHPGQEFVPDLVLVDVTRFREHEKPQLVRRMLAGTDYGVHAFDGVFVVVLRGADPARNGEVLAVMDVAQTTVFCANTPVHNVRGLDNVEGPAGRVERFWCGDGRRAPVTLSFGVALPRPAGRQWAEFVFRATPPARAVRGNWGRLSVHAFGEAASLAEAWITPDAGAGTLRTQRVEFVLEKAMPVEPRVTGGDAPLWADLVRFGTDGETP